MYRRELSLWIYDYRREQELARLDKGRQPLIGHEPIDVEEQNVSGYNEDEFLDKARQKILSRPKH